MCKGCGWPTDAPSELVDDDQVAYHLACHPSEGVDLERVQQLAKAAGLRPPARLRHDAPGPADNDDGGSPVTLDEAA